MSIWTASVVRPGGRWPLRAVAPAGCMTCIAPVDRDPPPAPRAASAGSAASSVTAQDSGFGCEASPAQTGKGHGRLLSR
jgi:hypothetical protein